VNKFTDLSDFEYKMMLGYRSDNKSMLLRRLSGDIPETRKREVNWVIDGAVTGVKD
jgi:hypothetical protein